MQKDAPIHRIRECAAIEAKNDERHEAEQAGQTDITGAASDGVNLGGNGEDVELCTDDGDDVS